MSLQLTSSSGEQTFYEAALRLNQDVENLSLLSYSYCITGISKPVDKVECTIAIQEIIKEYQRQNTNQRSRKGGSARKPQQYHAEAEVII